MPSHRTKGLAHGRLVGDVSGQTQRIRASQLLSTWPPSRPGLPAPGRPRQPLPPPRPDTAMAWPMPLVPPVTTARAPVSPRSTLNLLRSLSSAVRLSPGLAVDATQTTSPRAGAPKRGAGRSVTSWPAGARRAGVRACQRASVGRTPQRANLFRTPARRAARARRRSASSTRVVAAGRAAPRSLGTSVARREPGDRTGA